MHRILWFMFAGILSSCTTFNGKCMTDCCTDYYRDPGTKECLPCIGSFGPNCSSSCPDRYYGHGCRLICNCNDTEKCDPNIGCISRGNQSACTGDNCSSPCPEGFFGINCLHTCECYDTADCKAKIACIPKRDSKVEIFLLTASFGILAIFAGLTLHCVRRKRSLQNAHRNNIFNEGIELEIYEYAIPISSQECTSTSLQTPGIMTGASIDMCGKNSEPESLIEHRTNGRWSHEKARSREIEHKQLKAHTTLPVYLTEESLNLNSTPTKLLHVPYKSTTWKANEILNNPMKEDSQCCEAQNQSDMANKRSRASCAYSIIKYT